MQRASFYVLGHTRVERKSEAYRPMLSSYRRQCRQIMPGAVKRASRIDMVGSSFNAMHHNYFLKQRIVAQPIFSLGPSMGPRRSLHLHPCAGLAATDAAFYVAEPHLVRLQSKELGVQHLSESWLL